MKLEGSCRCGQVKWIFNAPIMSVTACSCTSCRRYGALWAYDLKGDKVEITGESRAFKPGKNLEFHFCPQCGCTTHYLGVTPEKDGSFRKVVNVRMALNPALIASIPIDHFDGFDTFEDLPSDGRCVKDMWF